MAMPVGPQATLPMQTVPASAPAGASPIAGAAPAGMNLGPLAGMMGGGGGGINPSQFAFMLFLAGNGFRDFVQNMQKLMGGGAGSHKTGGAQAEARQNPGMTTGDPRTAALVAQLARARAGGPSPAQTPLAAMMPRPA